MPFLAALVGNPKVLIAGGVALLFAAVIGTYAVKLSNARDRAAAAEAKLSEQLQVDAVLRVQIAEIAANRDRLVGEVRTQNEAIDALQRRSKELEGTATLRAVRLLREGEARRRAFIASPESGPAALNRWLASTLRP